MIRHIGMISLDGSESSKEEVQEGTEVQEQPIQLTGNLSVQRSHRVQIRNFQKMEEKSG